MLNFKEAPAGEHFWAPRGFMAKYRTGLSAGVPGPAPSQAAGHCCCTTVQRNCQPVAQDGDGGAPGWLRTPWHGTNPVCSGTAEAKSTVQINAINCLPNGVPWSHQSLCPSTTCCQHVIIYSK